MTTEWTLPLHYPAPPMLMNDRMHWATKAKRVKEVRRDVAMLARAFHMPRGLARAGVELHWVPASVRRRDADGPMPTLKAAVDGLIDYGLCADDSADLVPFLRCVIDPVVGDARGQSTTVCRVYLLVRDLSGVTDEDAA